tara:strand:- start:454 stop:639 length:186 start_codon:yes stop_codon:yes gene_type:complete
MNRIEYKKYRLLVISNYDNLMKNSKTWNTLTISQKWKSISKIGKKLQKINFNKNGEVKVAQ